MEPIEIEVKFLIPDSDAIRSKLSKLGAVSQGRYFERNIRFEDCAQSLIKQKALLRLRQDNVATLTFKSEPEENDPEFKIHRELEVEVSDFDTMKRILEGIGFHAEQVYEKWRETLVLGTTVFCIDQMPFGDFLEIEGRKDDIRRMAEALGLPWDRRILHNYLKIFDMIKSCAGITFNDVTFDNFADIAPDWTSKELPGYFPRSS